MQPNWVLTAGLIFAGLMLTSSTNGQTLISRQRISRPVANGGAVLVKSTRESRLVGLGNQLYSTGLEDVRVTITPANEPTDRAAIYLVSPGNKRLIASNYDNKSVNLGRLEAGEIVIGVEAPSENNAFYKTGEGSRNPDGLRHAVVRRKPDGSVEVKFETSLHNPATDWNWDRIPGRRGVLEDVMLTFTGGVTADANVPELLKALQSPDPSQRQTAAKVLKQAYPRMAKLAGLR